MSKSSTPKPSWSQLPAPGDKAKWWPTSGGQLSRLDSVASGVMASYLEKHYPIDFALLGRAGADIDAFVEQVIVRARARGFTAPDDLLRYLDLMMVLGVGFDADPQLPSVCALMNKSQARPTMQSLWTQAVLHVHAVAGPRGGLYARALLRAQKLSAKALTTTAWMSAGQISTLLERLHPEKFARMDDNLDSLLKCARTYAMEHRQGISSLRPLYAVLMFLLGSHFESDPRYAWAAELLKDSEDSATRTYDALHARASTELAWTLELLRKKRHALEED